MTQIYLDRFVKFGGYTPPTKRELEVAQLITDGLTNKEVAERLKISFHTVTQHRFRLMQKAEAHNSAQLVVWLYRNGYVKIKEEVGV